MKRFFLILAAASVSLAAFAQTRVQDSFFGVRLGANYKEVFGTDVVKNEYPRSAGMKNHPKYRLSVNNVRLGGREWTECLFYFDDEHRLYQLRFYDAFKNEDVSGTCYEQIMELLDKKYKDRPGIIRECRSDWEDSKYESVSYTDRDGGVCELVREYKASASGHYFNYVFLYYYNNKNVKMGVEHSYMEEL